MAVPADKTVANISGVYNMNRTLSGDTDTILSLQNIGWLKRKALSVAPVTITITHYPETGVINVDSNALNVIKSSEDMHIDGKPYEQNHPLWGPLKLTTQKIKLSELDDEKLKEGWVDEELLQVVATHEAQKWIATQIWGFQEVEVNGKSEKRHFRRVRLDKDGKKGVTYTHMVYDFSPSPSA
ncbi:hypothetical protein H072_7096 [Dactylellina haptotyla CBS 200.50]|uniref:Uncharacterized protein n=1 Tax=Dactylellina haptotyla (strain CBS 200.50) TaxID=1284197 RepID=S8A8G9_DACHA|nr:hypothetical protein H072_7096 [Dactylellina haptotyla CBS 200.50]